MGHVFRAAQPHSASNPLCIVRPQLLTKAKPYGELANHPYHDTGNVGGHVCPDHGDAITVMVTITVMVVLITLMLGNAAECPLAPS